MARIGVVAVLAIALLGGCSAEPMPTPEPSASSPAPIPQGDGVLTIGTLVPMSGEQAGWGLAQVAGVELAVREINEAGGVNGSPVVVYHRDSGDAASDRLDDAFAELVARGVDVVIGPSSIELARRLAPLAVEAQVPFVSPAITDNSYGGILDTGFGFRTSAPEAGDGDVLAAELEGASIALVHQSDPASHAVRERLTAQLTASGGSIVERVRLAPTTRAFGPVIDALAAARADAIVVVSGSDRAEQNAALLEALADAGLTGERLWLSRGFAISRSELPEGMLEGTRVLGALRPSDDFVALLRSAEPRLGSTRTGAEAYDAVVLVALAAVLSGNDAGAALAAALPEAASGGIPCGSFAECLHVLTTEDDIDYRGVSGPLDLDDTGDVRRGDASIYRYTAQNTLELAE